MAATKVTGRLSMPPTTAAASGIKSSSGLGTLPRLGATGAIGTASMAPMPATMAARSQVIRFRRRTGMPRRADRSVESEAALMAMPVSVRSRNHQRATSTTGTTTMATTSFWLKSIGPMFQLTRKGAPNEVVGDRWNGSGMTAPTAPKSCSRPMVTTIRTSLGALEKRQEMIRSAKRPVRAAATMPRRMEM
jgi:hypothetical protein